MRLRRIVMPQTARAGEIIEIRATILHPMVRGHSFGTEREQPRRIVTAFTVTHGGEEIFRCELFPGIAANPQFTFKTVATETGDVCFHWIDDTGEEAVETRRLTVTPA